MKKERLEYITARKRLDVKERQETSAAACRTSDRGQQRQKWPSGSAREGLKGRKIIGGGSSGWRRSHMQAVKGTDSRSSSPPGTHSRVQFLRDGVVDGARKSKLA